MIKFDINNYVEKFNSFGVGTSYYFIDANYTLVCEFVPYGYDLNNFFVLESSFYVLDKNGNISDLANTLYNKFVWVAQFEMKRIHFIKYQPDIIRIEFKNNIPKFEKRLTYYTKYIQFDDVKFSSHTYNRSIGFYGKLKNLTILFDALSIKENKNNQPQKMKFIKTREEFLTEMFDSDEQKDKHDIDILRGDLNASELVSDTNIMRFKDFNSSAINKKIIDKCPYMAKGKPNIMFDKIIYQFGDNSNCIIFIVYTEPNVSKYGTEYEIATIEVKDGVRHQLGSNDEFPLDFLINEYLVGMEHFVKDFLDLNGVSYNLN